MSKENKKLSRRKFIVGAASALALVAVGTGMSFLPRTGMVRSLKNRAHELLANDQVQYLRQIVTKDNAHSRTIMWQATQAMEQPVVVLRQRNKDQEQVIPAQQDFFQDDGTMNNQYSVLVDSLEAGQEYEYAVGDGQAVGKWHKLHTPATNEKNYSLLIFPDSQSADYSAWSNMAHLAYEKNPDVTMFVNMGDLVDNGEDSSQWHAWFHGGENLLEELAFAPVLGNHEYYDKNWKVRLPEAYLHYFQLPDNGSTNFQRYYYSYDYGDVHYVVLNTTEEETRDFRQGLMEEQLAWLEKDMAANTKKWKVVLMHRDVLQYRIHNRPERKEGFSTEGEIFMPLFEKYNIDVVFTAHLHTYRNRGHIYQQEAANKGPVYILTGVAGDVRYPGLWIDHALDQHTAPQPEVDNYLKMKVAPNQLEVSCYLHTGEEIDKIVINK